MTNHPHRSTGIIPENDPAILNKADKRTGRLFSILCLLFLLIPACAEPERPNILIITLDTVRADHISCYGSKPGLTPAIDRLADEGVRFSRAAAPAPITLPSHVSIFTGQYPIRHGVRDNSVYSLADSAVTLAEILKGAGYRTGASVASIALSSRFGVQQGFDEYLEGNLIVEDGQQGVVEREGREITEETLLYLDRMREQEQPFFFWSHYYDPHEPYIWHQEIDPGSGTTPYESEIRYVDVQVGRIMDYLRESGLDKNTLVVLVSDHGEGLGQHNERSHVCLIYETTIDVPFIMAGPMIAKGKVVDSCIARLVDVMPTVLEAASLDLPAQRSMDGESLLGLCRDDAGNGAKGPDIAYIETMGPVSFDWSPLDGVVTREWKYIRGPAEELFHLPTDPGELVEVQDKHPDILAHLVKATEAFAAITPETGEICDMAARQSELFGAIGYLSLDPHSRKPSFDAPHPRDMVSILDLLNLAQTFYLSARFEEAIEYYEKCIELSPGTAMFHEFMGKTKRRLNDHEGSIAAYRKALEIHPEMIDARLTLGIALVNVGDVKSAEKELREVIRRAPGMKQGYGYLANLMHRQKRVADEVEVLEALFENVTFDDSAEEGRFRQELIRARAALKQ